MSNFALALYEKVRSDDSETCLLLCVYFMTDLGRVPSVNCVYFLLLKNEYRAVLFLFYFAVYS